MSVNVTGWLEGSGLGEHGEAFAENAIEHLRHSKILIVVSRRSE